MPSLPIQDAIPGIGIIKFALCAQKIGLSMLIKFASQSVIFALFTKTDFAHLVSRDMIWLMEPVFSLLSIMPNLLTQDVVHGIGTTKFVSLVLKDGHSMLIKSVLLFLIFVPNMMSMEPVLPASVDTT